MSFVDGSGEFALPPRSLSQTVLSVLGGSQHHVDTDAIGCRATGLPCDESVSASYWHPRVVEDLVVAATVDLCRTRYALRPSITLLTPLYASYTSENCCGNAQSPNAVRYCWPLRDPRMCAILSNWRTLSPIVCDYNLTSVTAFRLRAYMTDYQTLCTIASLHLVFQHSIIVCISRGSGCGRLYRMLIRSQPTNLIRSWCHGGGC